MPKKFSKKTKKGKNALFKTESIIDENLEKAGEELGIYTTPLAQTQAEAKVQEELESKLKESLIQSTVIDDSHTRVSQKLSAELDLFKKENKRLRDENTQLMSKVEEYVCTVDSLKESESNLNSKLLDLNDKIALLEEANKKGLSYEMFEQFENKINELNKQIQSLETNNEKLKSKLNSRDKLRPKEMFIENTFTPKFSNPNSCSWN